MKKITEVMMQWLAVLCVLLVLSLALFIGLDQAVAGSNTPVEDGTTNIVGIVTATSTNVQDVAPVPSGIVPLVRKFMVSSGTLTFLGGGGGGTTNVTIGGGAATNTFRTGTAVTFSSADGWVEQSAMPVRDRSVCNGFSLGTYGGTAASGLVTGTVTTATVFYWIVGRTSAGPSTPGGYR